MQICTKKSKKEEKQQNILTLCRHSTLYTGGCADTIQSKYKSVPSRTASGSKGVPKRTLVSGTSARVMTFLRRKKKEEKKIDEN